MSNSIELINLSKTNKFDVDIRLLITNKSKAGCLLRAKKSNISYDLKILLQTENEDINELVNIFNSIESKKSLIIPTSLTGEILQGRLKRALKTIWISKILYIYEPFLIIKLFMKFIKNK